MRGNTKLQANAINSVSLTIISGSSTAIDDSETVIDAASAVKFVNDTIVSVKKMIIGETPIIISGPETLIFIPDTIIGGTPAIVSGSEIFISVNRYVFTGFDDVDKLVRDSKTRIGFAFPMEGDEFRVVRFDLRGAEKALTTMREAATKHSKSPRSTRDERL